MREINPDWLRLALERFDNLDDIAKRFNREPMTVLQAIKDAGFIKRTCLCCDTTFVSYGPGNRVCSRCKQRDAWHGVNDFQVL
jgi:hypothetical protein